MESEKSFTLIERGKKWWRNQLEEGKLEISNLNYAILLILGILSFFSPVIGIIAIFYSGYVWGKGVVINNYAAKQLLDMIQQMKDSENKS